MTTEGMTYTKVLKYLGNYIFMLRDGGEDNCTPQELEEMNHFLMSIGLIDSELIPMREDDVQLVIS